MQRAINIMTAKPHCCLPVSTAYEAASVMETEDCGIVPVINNEGQCVGVVTDRDLCLKVILERRDPDKTKLQEIMTYNPIICHPDDSLEDVLSKMEKRMVRRIPVVDERNQCIGIISEADIALKEEDKSKVSEFVKAVSR